MFPSSWNASVESVAPREVPKLFIAFPFQADERHDSFRILFHEYPVIHTIKFNPRDGHSRCEVFEVVNGMFFMSVIVYLSSFIYYSSHPREHPY